MINCIDPKHIQTLTYIINKEFSLDFCLKTIYLESVREIIFKSGLDHGDLMRSIENIVSTVTRRSFDFTWNDEGWDNSEINIGDEATINFKEIEDELLSYLQNLVCGDISAISSNLKIEISKLLQTVTSLTLFIAFFHKIRGCREGEQGKTDFHHIYFLGS